MLKKTNILMVVAHLDDEVVFGWPILQQIEKYNVEILYCSFRTDREKNATALCESLGIKYKFLYFENNFYKKPGKENELFRLSEEVCCEVSKFQYGYIYTHNEIGEYYHLDHVLLNRIITANFKDVLVSDIQIQNMWIKSSIKKDLISDRCVFDCVDVDNGKYKNLLSFYGRNIWRKRPQENVTIMKVQ